MTSLEKRWCVMFSFLAMKWRYGWAKSYKLKYWTPDFYFPQQQMFAVVTPNFNKKLRGQVEEFAKQGKHPRMIVVFQGPPRKQQYDVFNVNHWDKIVFTGNEWILGDNPYICEEWWEENYSLGEKIAANIFNNF